MTVPQTKEDALTPPKTIAIVGLSNNPEKPSFLVASYLQNNGFTIIPVNPSVTQVLGQKAYPSLSAIPQTLTIDVVDVFRQPAAVVPLLQELLDLDYHPFIWLQEGVGSEAAANFAIHHHMPFVMNICMMKEHQRYASN